MISKDNTYNAYLNDYLKLSVHFNLRQEGVLDMVKSRQEKWNIRMEEMRLERTTKKIFVAEMEGKRPRGRPR